ncbi:tRNA (adenosine(37)-N6)-dimethylallyltransferase MiaA [Aggregatimonas sangjinii]|uniref:tRNA dimethylallyltransferase n=1 Tax=Aggregatimonas sangjinii TaxID=2583587 RepID=A0A5B7STQ5_9FLAO|nr:tRNA (adenosine(37)-N6)-dimethylallyltransferase MiaA [Aggregatimonas sangjinii]QCX00250.1 tRNA (adenosine(37)-N6)-dimethylallyltransferase MiaA [Aggregatimonas sangjinii]
MDNILISIVGPTAIGKTSMAIALARHFNTEIISADSRQCYQEMRIGTAVPSKEELNAVPHHFIQHKSIFEHHTVGDFERETLKLLEKLYIQNDIAILVGGSPLYTDAVVYGLDDFPEVDPEIRERLNQQLATTGLESLKKQLKQLDPHYYEKVDLKNPHRVLRALEVCIGSGQPYSSFLSKKTTPRRFNTITVGIAADRAVIYERINQRVDLMMKQGLLEEAKSLHRHANLNALQTVGYRELFAYFDGDCDLDFAISEIKKNTRRFAKRQLTWYRKQEDILWLDYDIDKNEVIALIEKKLKTT